MNTICCYDINRLMKLFPNYEFRRIETTEETEEDSRTSSSYYIVKPEVKSVTKWFGCLWDSMTLLLQEGTKIDLKSDNVNSKDTTILRIDHNPYISPELTLHDGNHVEVTDKLIRWIYDNATTLDTLTTYLKNITTEHTMYDVITYDGVPNPVRYGDTWAACSTPLKLDERDIETVLNGIADELLRKKIECILYARVFTRNR